MRVSGINDLVVTISVAAKEDERTLLVRDVYDEAPLVLTFMKNYPDAEILQAVQASSLLQEFRDDFPKILHGKSQRWKLWEVRASPQRLILRYRRGRLVSADAAIEKLKVFNGEIDVVVSDATVIGIEICQPEGENPDLTVRIEASSSCSSGTHTIRCTKMRGENKLGSITATSYADA